MLVWSVLTRRCSDQEAGREWSFWAAGIEFWGCGRRCRQTERGRIPEERSQPHATATGKNEKSLWPLWAQTAVFREMLLVCVCYLNDEEECRGRIKGPIVKSDDSGAPWAEQVSNLQGRKQKNVLISVWKGFGLRRTLMEKHWRIKV